nr:sugar-binding domain-containing protein [Mesorhizobium sp. M9A.F.Ca.ET.002.03.1.2]
MPKGKPVDHPLNRQVLSPELDDYRNIPCRIIASGGTHKRAILLAVARTGLATVIVTDADSARTMLESMPIGSASQDLQP